MKLVGQHALGVGMQAIAEAFGPWGEAGLDPRKVLEVWRDSRDRSGSCGKAARVAVNDYSPHSPCA